MSHPATPEELDALAKKLIGDADVCVVSQRDMVNALSQELVVFDQANGTKVCKVYERMPVTEEMGS